AFGRKAPNRPVEDRAFVSLKTNALSREEEWRWSPGSKLQRIKAFDRQTPQLDQNRNGAGSKYTPLLSRIQHSQVLHDMKVATLPLGREIITGTISILASPYTGFKAAYRDLAGQQSLREYAKLL